MDITKGSIWTSIAELNDADVARFITYEADGHPVWHYRVGTASGVAQFSGEAKEVRGRVMWFLVFGTIYTEKE